MSPHFAQRLLGAFCYVLFVLPYVRRVVGRPGKERRIYVCNHVSLLDALVLGGVFWSRGRLPILVLGDRETWAKSGMRRLMGTTAGHMIDRGRSVRVLINDLKAYASRSVAFNLVVFPEGTRGDGVTVGECQPGIYYVAKAAGIPIVPVRLDGMQNVSSKRGRFKLFRGLRKVTVTFGEEFEVGGRGREEFLTLVRERIRQID